MKDNIIAIAFIVAVSVLVVGFCSCKTIEKAGGDYIDSELNEDNTEMFGANS